MSLAVEVKVFTEQSGMIHHPNESSLCCYVLYEKVLDYFWRLMHNFLIILAMCLAIVLFFFIVQY